MQINLYTVLNEDITEKIQKLEDYSGVKFPESYIGFINNYKTSSIGIYDIAVVLSQIDTRLTDNPDLEGDELIPIASLFAGNYLCFDFTKDGENPSICIWDHEESDKFQPVTYKVADSFSEFIEMLS